MSTDEEKLPLHKTLVRCIKGNVELRKSTHGDNTEGTAILRGNCILRIEVCLVILTSSVLTPYQRHEIMTALNELAVNASISEDPQKDPAHFLLTNAAEALRRG